MGAGYHRDQRHRKLLGGCQQQLLKDPVPHQSTRSTNRWMVPPQVSPMLKASSSAMPYVSRRGTPVSSTSCASDTTAPSTQPPDTDPTTSPSWLTARAAPGSRGDDLSVAITVASATFFPSTIQAWTWGSTSSISAAQQPEHEHAHGDHRDPHGHR